MTIRLLTTLISLAACLTLWAQNVPIPSNSKTEDAYRIFNPNSNLTGVPYVPKTVYASDRGTLSIYRDKDRNVRLYVWTTAPAPDGTVVETVVETERKGKIKCATTRKIKSGTVIEETAAPKPKLPEIFAPLVDLKGVGSIVLHGSDLNGLWTEASADMGGGMMEGTPLFRRTAFNELTPDDSALMSAYGLDPMESPAKTNGRKSTLFLIGIGLLIGACVTGACTVCDMDLKTKAKRSAAKWLVAPLVVGGLFMVVEFGIESIGPYPVALIYAAALCSMYIYSLKFNEGLQACRSLDNDEASNPFVIWSIPMALIGWMMGAGLTDVWYGAAIGAAASAFVFFFAPENDRCPRCHRTKCYRHERDIVEPKIRIHIQERPSEGDGVITTYEKYRKEYKCCKCGYTSTTEMRERVRDKRTVRNPGLLRQAEPVRCTVPKESKADLAVKNIDYRAEAERYGLFNHDCTGYGGNDKCQRGFHMGKTCPYKNGVQHCPYLDISENAKARIRKKVRSDNTPI